MSEQVNIEIVMLSDEMAPLALEPNDTRYRIVSAPDRLASPQPLKNAPLSPAFSESEPLAPGLVSESEDKE